MLTIADEILIKKYLQGDEKSLEILIQRYLKPIYSFIYRFIGNEQDAEDVTQEVFVKAWRNFKKFDQEKNFKTWIFSIAKNTAIDFLKKKKTIPFSEFSSQGESTFGGENAKGENMLTKKITDVAPLPNELLENVEIAQKLASAINKLSPKYRMVLFLRYNDHFNFREIAEIFGESLNTIKSRHRRAILILKKMLKVEDE
jgi:RNA polymerase sigma-70 factor (ECF subfamily)